jgi:hypothetical protein
MWIVVRSLPARAVTQSADECRTGAAVRPIAKCRSGMAMRWGAETFAQVLKTTLR